MSTDRDEKYMTSDRIGTREDRSFIALQPRPSRLTKREIAKCADPDEIKRYKDEEQVTYIAVLRLDGVVNWGEKATQFQDAAAILYVNPEGESFWKVFEVPMGVWDEIPRYCDAPADAASNTPDYIKTEMEKVLPDHRRYEKELEAES